MKKVLTLAAIIFSVSNSLSADFYLGSSNFKPDVLDKPIEAFWSPTSLKSTNKISFWGEASQCLQSYEGAVNGPTKVVSNILSDDPSKATGVSFGIDPLLRKSWSPSSASLALCPQISQNLSGLSYVYMDADSVNGGIGLYTYSGPNSFFGPYSLLGQGQSGANSGIVGNFFTSRMNSKLDTAVKPWTSLSDEFRIRTLQTVRQAKVTAADQQVKQQVVTTVLNRYCTTTTTNNCQLQYLIEIGLYRNDPNYWNGNGLWWKSVSVTKDPAQKGMTVIDGSLGDIDSISYFDPTNTKIPLFKSMGSPTQFDLFENKIFDVRISFDHFINGQRIAAQKYKQRASFAETSDQDIAELFGARWKDPNEWVILSVMYAQENSNLSSSLNTSLIAGNFKGLQMGSATLPLKIPNYLVSEKFNSTQIERNSSWIDSSGYVVLSATDGYAQAPVNVSASGKIKIRYSKGPNRGILNILVNGNLFATKDLFDANSYGDADFILSGLPTGNHVIRFVRSSAKNAAASDYAIVLNSFEQVEDTFYSNIRFIDPLVFKTANSWFEEVPAGFVVFYLDGAYAEVPVKVGASGIINLKSMNGPNRGIVDIYVDGKFLKSLDMFNLNYVPIVQSIAVPTGPHRLKIVRSGRTSATGKDIVLDSVQSD